MIMVIVCGHAAGLSTDVHTCSCIGATQGKAEASRLLTPFPVIIKAEPSEGCDAFTAQALPGNFLLAILTAALGEEWASSATIYARPCNCAIKTAVVPESGTTEWEQALVLCPYGKKAVRPRYAYRGISLGCAAIELLDVPGIWSAYAIEDNSAATWAPAVGRIQSRGSAVAGALSLAIRSVDWSMFMDSSMIYPSMLCALNTTQMLSIMKTARLVVPNGRWTPWYVISGIWALFRIRGAPRHPAITQRAALLRCWLRGQYCAPEGFTDPAPALRTTCRQWGAQRIVDIQPTPAHCRKTQRARVHKLCNEGSPTEGKALTDVSVDIYLARWRNEHKAEATRWMRNHATNRRWWPTEGQEFSIIADARCFNTAYHCLRLLAGGISGTQGFRDNDTRTAYPKRCIACNTDRIAYTWHTPSPGQAGLAWCRACAPTAVHRGNAWALLTGVPTDCGGTPVTQIAIAGERTEHDQPDEWVRAVSIYGLCPLCELSSEHLVVWCPAVALAWDSIFGHLPLLHHPGLGEPIMKVFRSRVAAFLHQVSFLALSSYGKPPSHGLTRGHLVKAARATLSRSHRASDEDNDCEDDGGQEDPDIHGLRELTLPDVLWALPSEACDTCGHLQSHG